MNNKFLDKVIYQIISETRIIDNKVHSPFSTPFFLSQFYPFSFSSYSFSSHCKEVYSLNEQEIEYVWKEYKKEVTTLIDKKELSYE
tara:strand:- start:140 stop:397 length:258 start_codon:yes stop_codon:yes gene_type:complete